MGRLPVAARQHDRASGWGNPDKAAKGMRNLYELCRGQDELLLEDLVTSVRASFTLLKLILLPSRCRCR